MQLYIAEDNASLAKIWSQVASTMGWTPILCSDGMELVERLKEDTAPAVLLIDINMPRLNGIEVIEKIKDTDREVKIYFVTGGHISSSVAAEAIAQASGLNVGKSLTKPLALGVLKEILETELKDG